LHRSFCLVQSVASCAVYEALAKLLSPHVFCDFIAQSLIVSSDRSSWELYALQSLHECLLVEGIAA
jgi:hypothetical protein